MPKKIVVMTGAGFSVPSGIPDFRSAGGLYHEQNDYRVSPETILSRTFFFTQTSEFYRFYRSKMIYPEAKPNVAHHAVSKFEQLGKSVTVITQNIDGLHQQAGSSTVIELHGSIHRNYCIDCHQFFTVNDILTQEDIPKCPCGGIIKPDVVLYEEPLDHKNLEQSVQAIAQSDLLIVAGTSLNVQPAASLVHYYQGNRFVLINLSRTPYDGLADLVFYEPLETILCDDLFVD